MIEPQTAAEFCAAVASAYQEWEMVLAAVGEPRMTVPSVDGAESIKDVIAHVAWYEREMIGVLHEHALAGSDLWGLSTNARNVAIFAANRDRPLAEVLTEARNVHRQLLAELAALTDADLADATRFRDMPPAWHP